MSSDCIRAAEKAEGDLCVNCSAWIHKGRHHWKINNKRRWWWIQDTLFPWVNTCVFPNKIYPPPPPFHNGIRWYFLYSVLVFLILYFSSFFPFSLFFPYFEKYIFHRWLPEETSFRTRCLSYTNHRPKKSARMFASMDRNTKQYIILYLSKISLSMKSWLFVLAFRT